MIKSIAFCILHFGQSAASLDACVESIRSQGVPDFEILVCGMEAKNPFAGYIKNEEWARKGELNMMRNALCAGASKDFMLLLESDVELSPDWYEEISGADCFDVAGSSVSTRAGKRCVDWACAASLGNGHLPYPLQYDEWTNRAYIRAALMLVRKSVWDRVKFDWNLPIDGDDDADFCLRAAAAGFRIGVFPLSRALYRDDPGKFAVRRYITFEEPLRIVNGFTDAFGKGKAAFNAKDYDLAIKQFEKAASVVPAEAAPWSHIGWSHYYRLRYPEAVRAFDRALELSPEHHFALRGRGWAHIQTGNYTAAIADLNGALKQIRSEERQAWHEAARGLGWAHYHRGGFDEAIRLFAEIVERTDANEKGVVSEALNAMGWSHFRKDNFNEAVECFNRALRNRGPETKAHAEEAFRGMEMAAAKLKEAHLGAAPSANTVVKRAMTGNLMASIKDKIRRLRSGFERLTFPGG